MGNKPHLALYGNVQIPRMFCLVCQTWALVVDGLILCCDRTVDEAPTRVKRVSEPEHRRRRPSARAKKAILAEQNHTCLYCFQGFGHFASYGKGRVKLRLVWDHMVPYAYGADSRAGNFAAACHVCNGWKSDHIFKTIEEARTFLGIRWSENRRVMDSP